MWKNRSKNVESGDDKILYETLIDFFYSETVLNFSNKPRICFCDSALLSQFYYGNRNKHLLVSDIRVRVIHDSGCSSLVRHPATPHPWICDHLY